MTESGESIIKRHGQHDGRMCLALVLLWSRAEPQRVGEAVLIPPGLRTPFTVGRATDCATDGTIALGFCQTRPTSLVATGPLIDGKISRRQFRLRVVDDNTLNVELSGRGELVVNGQSKRSATVKVGDIIERRDRVMLLVSKRPAAWLRQPNSPGPFRFATADPHGLVGESPALWQLRQQLAFVASRDEHVLIVGPTGAGKELVVRAIHQQSNRRGQTLVARNAATIPTELVDAELFGNLRNYPNPGTPDRPGLLGEGNNSSLFLDEIGELPQALQARLLRVMDRGEYQRLGEAHSRTTNVRILGATNRSPSALKHDVLARFALRVKVGPLCERRDDIPLLLRHLACELGQGDANLKARFFQNGQPRLCPDFVRSVVQHPPPTNARGLTAQLLRSFAESPGEALERPTPQGAQAEPSTELPTREQIVAALERAGGVRERAWRDLGLKNRFQLGRLLKRHDIK